MAEKLEFVYCVLGGTWPARKPTKTYKGTRGGFVVQYGIKNFGFGEVTFNIQMDGRLVCDPETCSPDFVKQVMVELTNRAWFDHLSVDNKELRKPIVDDKNQHGARSDEPEDYQGGLIMAPDTIKKVKPKPKKRKSK